ncbi:MAG: protein kinase [Verrucomicrobia bacterium]|nr:protein kinase [Verrucomicrobiota bacterium]
MNDQLKSPAVPRLREIFLAALGKAGAEERAAFVSRACGNDRALRERVDELLREHDTVGTFLETPAAAVARVSAHGGVGPGGTAVVSGVTEKPGDRIGRFKLLQKIGEGGCGVVYMAEQEEPVRRRVALKIIRLGMDTKSVIARFEAERQALAMMDHPNIAKVLDAGATETGRPFFVMELVRGIRITEYCDQNNLTNDERLRLFVQVCQAIQHAHQKGVIHRDIKPSNILVTLHDGTPVPKVIDFGIAKATEQRLTDKTLFTEFQSFMGTPAYTSPEQAEMSGLDIDTRSDIYSLGVLLYELLTGQTPFQAERLVQSGLDEMRRIIREEEPVRPSTRLSSLNMTDATALTKARHSKIPALVQAIRGDLDWIVMKCLEKDRMRRYETANGLGMDIQRYLDNEPVLARPPSTAYRVQKFVRRNKVMVAASATVAVVLVAAAVVGSWLAIRATQAEAEQSRLYQSAEAALKNEAKQRQRAETEELAALRRSYNSDMNLVQQALAANNLGRVVDLLDRHRPSTASQISNLKSQMPPDFRQWEWRYFWNQSRSAAAFALPQQTHAIETVALSPNGRLLASSDRQGTLKLWDLMTRTEVAVIRERGPGERGFPPRAFAFSSDGSLLAAVFPGSGPWQRAIIKVCTIATRQVTAEIQPEGGVEALAFNRDDSMLFMLGQDMAVRVWDFEKQQLKVKLPRQQIEGWRRAVFSPDTKWVAFAEGGVIRVHDLDTGVERSRMDTFESDVAALAFSPKGDLLAVSPLFSGTSTTIKLFSTATGREAGELAGHVSWVPGLTFTADGQRLLSAGADQTIRIWDAPNRRALAVLRGHLSEVNCVAVTPDGKTIVSGCKDGTLFGWAADSSVRKRPFETLPVSVASVEFFPGSQRMLSVNTNLTVSVWNLATLEEVERIAALGNDIVRVLVSPDGARVYASTFGGEVKVLDWATRLMMTNLGGPAGRSGRFGQGGPGGPPGGPGGRRGPGGPGGRGPRGGLLALADNGRTLVASGSGASVRLFDTSSWGMKAEWRMGDPFSREQMILSPDERFLLVPASDGTIEFRNLTDGQTNATVVAQNWGVSGMAFSPDGHLLAISSRDGTVNLWDPAERKILDVLRGHLLGVHAVAFSPDGQRLATVSHGNEAIKLWDVSTRHEVATLAGEGSLFDRVKLSPDGQWLVAINREGQTHLWRAPSLGDIATVEARQ